VDAKVRVAVKVVVGAAAGKAGWAVQGWGEVWNARCW
jgi:hypothetical protein